MNARVWNLGSELAALENVGPPEVQDLATIAGNGTLPYRVSDWWQEIRSLSFLLTTNGTAGNRLPRLSFFAGENVPFCQVVAPVLVTAGLAVQVTFARDVQQGGGLAVGALVTGMPELLLTPGWSVVLDCPGGLAGDSIAAVRLLRQRLEPVELER